MKNFKELFDTYRICPICKSDGCLLTLLNERDNNLIFDLYKDELRIPYKLKLFKINLLTNKVSCVDDLVKSKSFSKIGFEINSRCLSCQAFFSSNNIILSETTKPMDLSIKVLEVDKRISNFIYNIKWKDNKIYINKANFSSNKMVYKLNFDCNDINNINIDKYIEKSDKLSTFS